MNAKAFGLGLAAAALVAAPSLPAHAQVVDDFLCSTFSFHCQEAPPPPPAPAPALAPEPAADAPVKKVRHHAKKKVVKKKAPAADAAPADAAAPAAPAPADAGAPK